MDASIKEKVKNEVGIQLLFEEIFFLLTLGLYIKLKIEYEDELYIQYRVFMLEQLLT